VTNHLLSDGMMCQGACFVAAQLSAISRQTPAVSAWNSHDRIAFGQQEQPTDLLALAWQASGKCCAQVYSDAIGCATELLRMRSSTRPNDQQDTKARREVVTIDRRDFDAAIFDLDGVLTETAGLHAAAWKAAFDAILRSRAKRQGIDFRPFDIQTDYLDYVDGRPRYDGVRTFLASRGMHLPDGSEHDPDDAETIHAIGGRKTRLFLEGLERGIDPAPGAKELLTALRQADIRIAVGSSSENCGAILRAAGLDRLMSVVVDGVDAERLGLPGKPDPALFLEAARRLEVKPARAILFEDALAGVEAGRRGGFRRVIGIDATDRQPEALRQHGADIVIASLLQVGVVPVLSVPLQGPSR
jgi:beta-phosphoglucomutase family hydrolase